MHTRENTIDIKKDSQLIIDKKQEARNNKRQEVVLEGVGDEEILDGQGGMSESNRNPDLMKW